MYDIIDDSGSVTNLIEILFTFNVDLGGVHFICGI
jgi:hypothetical protein